MVTASDRIDGIVRDSIAPVLKPLGFRKKGRNWRRGTEHGVQVVNLQASSWNQPDSGRFTINLAVYFPMEADLAESGTAGRSDPSHSDCIVRERIGMLMPEARDHWWTVQDDADEAEAGREAAAALSEHGLPWLNAHADPLVARRWTESKGLLFWSSVFALRAGEPRTASELLAEAIRRSGDAPSVEERLRDWGARHGVLAR